MTPARLSLFLALICACSNPRRVPAPSDRDGHDLAALQGVVLRGSRTDHPSACTAGAILGVIDAEEAGDRIETLLQSALRARTSTASPSGRCLESLAVGRLIRLARLGRVDVAKEMAAESPILRAVALRYVALVGTEADRQHVTAAFDDPARQVRIVAYLAAARLGMKETVDTLTARLEGATGAEGPWICRALAALDSRADCETAASLYVMESGDAAACEAALANLQSADSASRIEAMSMLLVNQFGRFADPLDRIGSSHDRTRACDLSEEIEDAIIEDPSQPPRLRALAAARILWQRHPPIGEAKAFAGTGRPDALRSCASDSDCRASNVCVRRTADPRGVCAVLVDRFGRPVTPAELRIIGGCWSFADCPPFFSCHRYGPHGYGVCVRR